MDAGQRPTEKRIFYAGSTLGPNRMVRLAQGRTGAARHEAQHLYLATEKVTPTQYASMVWAYVLGES